MVGKATKSEFKKVEAAQRHSEEKFKALVETSPDWVWEVNEKAQYTYISPKVKDLLGYTPKEVLGKTPFDLMPKDEAARVGKIFRDIARKKEPFFSLENRNLHKLGHEVILETSGVPLVDKSGNLQGYMGVDRDITERRKAEERYKLLFDTSRDAIMTLAPPSWNFTSGNKSAIEMFGVKDEKEFVSRAPWEYSPETQSDGQSSKDKAKGMILKAMKEDSNFFDWTHKRLNGEVFPATVLLTKVKINSGEFLQATVRDITERKEAEDNLRESEERFRTIFEAAGDMLFFLDPTGKVLTANSVVENVLGYTPDEMVGKHFSKLKMMPKGELLTSRKVIAALLAGESPPFREMQLRHKDGHFVTTEAQLTAVRKDGEMVGILGVTRDITERKKAEEERLKLQEQELLEKYTKHLEKKLKSLEKDTVGLKQNEGSVLAALTASPLSNDKELSKLTGLKRSTVTAIRNRLKHQGWYQLVNMPHPSIAPDGTICVYHYEQLSTGKKDVNPAIIKAIRNSPWCTFCQESDNFIFAIAWYPGAAEARNHFKSVVGRHTSKGELVEVSRALLPMQSPVKCYDFSSLLSTLLGASKGCAPVLLRGETRLSRSAKLMLHALAKLPEATNEEIHKFTGLSKPTVLKTKRALFSQGIMRRIVVPNIELLGCTISCFNHLRFEDPTSDKRALLIEEIANDSSIFLAFVDEEQLITFHLFNSLVKLERNLLNWRTRCRELFGVRSQIESHVSHNSKTLKFTFDEFVKKCFPISRG